jgi:hypothetical protein
MARPRKIPYEVEQNIVRLRKQYYSCEATAQMCDVSIGTVYHVMRKYGLNGKIHAAHERAKRRPSRAASITDKVRRHGEVTIESGLNNGFIATIDGEWTGGESGTVLGAINSAEERRDATTAH